MKRSKSLVITSLLFSTMVLNPSVIQGVIVQADAANQAPITATAPETGANHAEETRDITVKYLDSTNNMKKIPNGTMKVSLNAKKVNGETVPMPDGYQVTGRRVIHISGSTILVHVKPTAWVEDNKQTASKSDVVVKYVNDSDANVKLSDGLIKDVDDSATSVNADQVSVPKGYQLAKNQPLTVSYGRVTVHLVATKQINIKYLDSTNNMKKIPNGTMEVPNNAKTVNGETVPMPDGYQVTGRRVIHISGSTILVHVKPTAWVENNKQTTSKSDVVVKYVNDKNTKDRIADGVVKDVDDSATSVAASQVAAPKGYKLVKDQSFSVSYGRVTVHVVPNMDTISVKYLDSTNNMKKIPNGTMEVKPGTKKVAGETVPMPEGYQISGRRIIYVSHGQILVHVKPIGWDNGIEMSKSDVVVKYVNDKNSKEKIADGVIKDVNDDATSVTAKQVTVPKGYQLVKNQKLTVSYGRVIVHVVPAVKQITIKYLDSTNNMKKISNGTMEVAKKARKVAGETVPMPKGYQISGRRFIGINHGQILVHVKPIGWDNGIEMSKSDVVVKYVNDKNTKDKIADGVIKDVKDDATSVDSSLVFAPKGYQLVENQKFAVSYGRVTVHVTPEKKNNSQMNH